MIAFLGFSIYRAQTRDGKQCKTVFQTENKRFTLAKARMKERLHRCMHREIKEQVESINSFLVGHYNYYGLAGNIRKMQDLWHYTLRQWRRCLSQRSQKGSTSWEKIEEHRKRHPIVTPRIQIQYRDMLSYVRL